MTSGQTYRTILAIIIINYSVREVIIYIIWRYHGNCLINSVNEV
jgi:hypothetical protein